jgi:hypothetical protein
VLDSIGCVHVRYGLNSALSRTGRKWELLTLEGMTGAVISIAASRNSLWVVTSDGEIWASDPIRISWTKIDRPKNASNERLDQVRASPTGKYVWIFAPSTGRSWARNDINEINPKGKMWSEACNDVKVADLAIAENAVWCLSTGTFQLHRLRSLSLSNPSGLYWKPFPFHFRAISVDAYENRLWAFDMESRIVRHQMEIYPKSCLTSSKTPSFTSHALPVNRSTSIESNKVFSLKRSEELPEMPPLTETDRS